MTSLAASLLRGLLALGVAAQTAVPTAPGSDPLVGPGADAVPYLSQTPLLCGGAAAAMLERFLGVRGVYARDYQELVRPELGGIRTGDLADALRSRGWTVHVQQGTPPWGVLADGLPFIALLEGTGTVLHYVLVVAATPDEVVYHDPNAGPGRRLPRDRFLARWRSSDYWSLAAAPLRTGPDGSEAEETDPGRTWARPGEDAPAAATGGGSAADSALVALEAGSYSRALALADVLEWRDGRPDLAQRIRATAHFLSGDEPRALEAWNQLDEPRIDLVSVRGMDRTRHGPVVSALGLRSRELLTPAGLALAQRRLAHLPSVRASRLGFQMVENGDAEVKGHVLPEPVIPGRTTLAVEGVGALVNRRARIAAGPLLGAADRWTVAGSWTRAQEEARWTVRSLAPPLPGILEAGIGWRRERYAGPAGEGTAESLRGWVGVERWVAPDLRVGGGGGLERFAGGGRAVLTHLTVRLGPGERGMVGEPGPLRWQLTVDATGATGVGMRSWGGIAAHGQLDLRAGPRRHWRLAAGAEAVSRSAPRLHWPGAGTGRLREALLRGYPLDADGAIQGPALGRALLHGTLERRFPRRLGPLEGGITLFVDGAVVRSGAPESAGESFWSPGVALFLHGIGRGATVSLAHGDGWHLSLQVVR